MENGVLERDTDDRLLAAPALNELLVVYHRYISEGKAHQLKLQCERGSKSSSSSLIVLDKR